MKKASEQEYEVLEIKLPSNATHILKQKAFFGSTLHPLMERVKDGSISLLFLDASHFVMGSDFLVHTYGKIQCFAKTFSGRRLYNVPGVMDYVSKKVWLSQKCFQFAV